MCRATGTVTEVGVGQIQFYIPHEVSKDCIFNPDDEFEAVRLDGVGLLLLNPEETLTVDDVVDAIDCDD